MEHQITEFFFSEVIHCKRSEVNIVGIRKSLRIDK